MNATCEKSAVRPLLVLVPSPLLGPFSWSLVADALRRDGYPVIVTRELRDPLRRRPCWHRTVGGVEASLASTRRTIPVVLVAHGGSGPLLPAIAATLRRWTQAYLFVDAELPSDGVSRLHASGADSSGGPHSAADITAALLAGRRFPIWTDADLRPLVPNPIVRARLLADLRPGGRRYWTEPLPEVRGWPNAPVGYLRTSLEYLDASDHALRAGWVVNTVEKNHFELLLDPAGVAETLIGLLHELIERPAFVGASTAPQGATP